jgi:hypothetical protein
MKHRHRTQIALALAIAMPYLIGCEPERFPSGKDTVASFGDGRFQILRGIAMDGPHALDLCDVENSELIASSIRDWRQKRGMVFTIDYDGKIHSFASSHSRIQFI